MFSGFQVAAHCPHSEPVTTAATCSEVLAYYSSVSTYARLPRIFYYFFHRFIFHMKLSLSTPGPYVRMGNTITDTLTAQLFQSDSSPSPAKNVSSTSLDSNGESESSGDEWTHVTASDVAGAEPVIEGSTLESTKNAHALDEEDMDALLLEVVLLRGFFLSQEQAKPQSQLQRDEGGEDSIDMASLLSSSSSGGYTPASAAFLHAAVKETQRVLDCFGSDEVLNMRALQNNPTYLSR